MCVLSSDLDYLCVCRNHSASTEPQQFFSTDVCIFTHISVSDQRKVDNCILACMLMTVMMVCLLAVVAMMLSPLVVMRYVV